MGLFTIEKPGQGLRARLFAIITLGVMIAWGAISCHQVIYDAFDYRVQLPDPNVSLEGYRYHDVTTQPFRLSLSKIDFTVVIESAPNPSAVQTEGGLKLPYVIEILQGGTWRRVARGTVENGTVSEPMLITDRSAAGSASSSEAGTTSDDDSQGTGDGDENTDGESPPPDVMDGDAESTSADESGEQPQTQPSGDESTDNGDAVVAEGAGDDAGTGDTMAPIQGGVWPGFEDYAEGDYIRSDTNRGIHIYVMNPVTETETRLDTIQTPILEPGQWWDYANNSQVNGSGIPISGLIGLVTFLFFFFFAWRFAFGTWGSKLLIETDQELNRVNWPSRERIRNSAVVVVLCVLFFGLLLFGTDALLNQLVQITNLYGAS